MDVCVCVCVSEVDIIVCSCGAVYSVILLGQFNRVFKGALCQCKCLKNN